MLVFMLLAVLTHSEVPEIVMYFTSSKRFFFAFFFFFPYKLQLGFALKADFHFVMYILLFTSFNNFNRKDLAHLFQTKNKFLII